MNLRGKRPSPSRMRLRTEGDRGRSHLSVSFRRHEPCPKRSGVRDPPFGARAGVEPEAVTEIPALPVLHLRAGRCYGILAALGIEAGPKVLQGNGGEGGIIIHTCTPQ